MRKILIAIAALAVGAIASAQYQDTTPDLGQSAVGFSFRVGVYWPADNAMRDISNTFSDVGMEYELEKSLLSTGRTYISGDWISNKFVGGEHVANLTLNQRIYTRNQRFSAGGTPYFFLGGGVEFIHVNHIDTTTWCVRGGIGAEFKGNYFIEFGGYLSPKKDGINPSGIAGSIGYRFQY